MTKTLSLVEFLITNDENITQQRIKKLTVSLIKGNQFRVDASAYKFIPILIVGLFGNIAIIVYFLKIYGCRRIGKISNNHLLIVLLAMIDLVVVILNTINSTVLKSMLSSGDFDQMLLLVSIVLQVGSNTTSCWMLVMLAYERYRSIVHPFKTSFKKRHILIVFILVWIVCIMVNVPAYMPFFVGNSENNVLEGNESISFSIILLMLDCIFPSVIIAFLNWRISRYLKKNSFTNETPMNIIPSSVSSRVNRQEIASSTSSSSQQCCRNKKNENATKTLRNLVIIYILCVWPGRLEHIAMFLFVKFELLFYLENYLIISILDESFDFLMFVNNVVNVFVYAFMIRKFRSFLWKLLSCGTYGCGKN